MINQHPAWRSAKVAVVRRFWTRRVLVEWTYRFIVGNSWGDHDIIAMGPIGWGRNLEVRRELKRVDDAQDFIEVPAATSNPVSTMPRPVE